MRVYYDSTSTNTTPLVFDHRPRGLLTRAQIRLQEGSAWWFGNRLSDLRYWLWRLIR